MATFCKIGFNAKVLNTIEVSDADCQDADGNIDQETGRQFLEAMTNYPNWILEPTGLKVRASKGSTWDEDQECFIPKNLLRLGFGMLISNVGMLLHLDLRIAITGMKITKFGNSLCQ